MKLGEQKTLYVEDQLDIANTRVDIIETDTSIVISYKH